MTTNQVKKPILIVGAARSGTTMMGELLSTHPDIAFWSEPNHIWRFGNVNSRSDVLISEDARPEVRSYIYNHFSEFLRKRKKNRFMEKTPSNCFRMPFIKEIFPDAKILHVIRDGRDVAISAIRQWGGNNNIELTDHDTLTLKKKVSGTIEHLQKLYQIHQFSKHDFKLKESPFYLNRFKLYMLRILYPGKPQIWGPRFPGIENVFQTYSLLETCAIQWDWSVRAALGYGRNLNSKQYLEIKYEDFLNDPVRNLNIILDYLELDKNSVVYDTAMKKVRRDNLSKWHDKYSEEELKVVMSHIEPTLKYLEYI